MGKSDDHVPPAGVSLSPLRPGNAKDCDAGAETFLQTGFWGSFKSGFGWKPLYLLVGSGQSPLLVLERRLARGFSFAYIPRGPRRDSLFEGGMERLADMAEALRSQLSPACVFLRMDPPLFTAGAEALSLEPPALQPPFRRAAADIQPPDTTILELKGKSDEDLLSGMKPKWRYNIKYAEKKGVTVSAETGPGAVEIFYSLYRITAERDRIALHPAKYYERLLSLAEEYGNGAPVLRLWVARYEGEPLAAIITSFFGEEAVYLYGASGDAHRNLMPAYALQWAAIRAARDAGCSFYDFYGIPPAEDSAHPMAGLYRFKTGFGGLIRRYAGSWDYAFRKPLYRAYRAAESLRGFWYKTVRKRLTGGRR